MNDNDVDGEIEAPAGEQPGDFEMHCDSKGASVKIVNGFAMQLADALCDSIGGNYLQTLIDLPEGSDPGTAMPELAGDVESRRGRRFGISVVFRDLAKPTLGELHRKERDRANALEAELAAERASATTAGLGLFYRELARRIVDLANALQYENAYNLLRLAMISDEGQAPEAIAEAATEVQFAYMPLNDDGYDHERFCAAVDSVTAWLNSEGKTP